MDLFKKSLEASLKVLKPHKKLINASLYGFIEDSLLDGADISIYYVNGELREFKVKISEDRSMPNINITIANYTNIQDELKITNL